MQIKSGWLFAGVALMLAGCGEDKVAELPQTIAPAAVEAAPAVVPAGLEVPLRFQAVGMEPFWAVEVDGDQANFSTPDNPPGLDFTLQRSSQDGQLLLNGELTGAPAILRLAMGPCSDGMSETVYPWTAEWQHGDVHYRGCARPV